MRKANLLDALFPVIRRRLLAALVAAPERQWTLSDLAHHLQVRPSSLQREVASLTEVGIVLRATVARRVIYQINSALPFLGELQGLFAKTSDVSDQIRAALEPLLQSADFGFIFGSVARGQQTADSDVDLLIVGDVPMRSLSPALRQIERDLDLTVSAAVYSRAEFLEKRERGNHFLSTIITEPKIFLKGTEDDLADIDYRPESKTTPNEPAGTR